MKNAVTELSVIIPVMNEEKNVEPLWFELAQNLEKSNLKAYEIIFVDDGSTDRTLNQLKKIRNNHLKIIALLGHQGKGAALRAAFSLAQYPHFLTMDGDLQDDPKEIRKFIAAANQGYDMVVGWKYNRKDAAGKVIASKIANWVTARTIGLRIHDMDCGFKLFKKEITNFIPLHGDLYRYIPPLAASKGYQIAEVKVHHRKRRFGHSKYGWKRLISGGLDFISVFFLTKYLHYSLHFFGLIGLATSFGGSIILGYLGIIRILGEKIGGRPLLILGVLMVLMGIQFLSFGLLGELIANQKNNQQSFLIREKYGTFPSDQKKA